jgi:hypothetical protein
LDDNYRHPADEKKVKFKKQIIKSTKKGSQKSNIIWIGLITVISFFTSAILSIISSELLKNVDILVSFIVILVIIALNILADIIGTAVTAAEETPFHAMASRKVYGAKKAIQLIRNADKVSNVCNDVIGDICGVISGAAAAYIIFRISQGSGVTVTIVELAITGCVAAFTVGGKALGKILAISNSNFIIYKVSVIIQFITGRFVSNKAKGNAKNNGTKRVY